MCVGRTARTVAAVAAPPEGDDVAQGWKGGAQHLAKLAVRAEEKEGHDATIRANEGRRRDGKAC
jgi:hypothetical protein